MDNRKVIIASYVAASLVLWLLVRYGVVHLLAASWAYKIRQVVAHMPQVGQIAVKEGIPVLFGGGLLVFLSRHPRINTFMEEVVAELKKVTWPSRDDVVRSTIVVIVCICIASAILGVYDAVWGQVVSFFLKG